MELLPTDKPEWPVTIDWNTHQPLCSMICIAFGHLAANMNDCWQVAITRKLNRQ